jgi:hypothetical protein
MDGMGWDGMGWDGMGWMDVQTTAVCNRLVELLTPSGRAREPTRRPCTRHQRYGTYPRRKMCTVGGMDGYVECTRCWCALGATDQTRTLSP